MKTDIIWMHELRDNTLTAMRGETDKILDKNWHCLNTRRERDNTSPWLQGKIDKILEDRLTDLKPEYTNRDNILMWMWET